MSKINIQRARKVLELARRGEGGERETAQRQLEKMLAAAGMTLADLTGDEAPTERAYRYRSKDELRLLMQITATVCNTTKPEAYRYRTVRGQLAIVATPTEHVDIAYQFAVYAAAYRKQKKALLSAFIMANDIYPAVSRESPETPETMTKKQLDEARLAHRMASGMARTEIRRALPGGAA